jgi:biopolymer transport protein ExbD
MQVQEDKAYDDINITPMLDLAYVLLVIFILMTTASVQGMKVNLPKASAQPSLAKPKTVSITVTDSGQVFMDAVPVTLQDLGAMLRARKASEPEMSVIVRGDAATQYQNVSDVIAVCGEAGIQQVGLATKRATGQ